MGGFSKMRGGDGGGLQHPPPTAGPSGPRPSAGPRAASAAAAAAAAADVMVKEEPEDEDEAAADEEYLPDDEYLGEEFGETGFKFCVSSLISNVYRVAHMVVENNLFTSK